MSSDNQEKLGAIGTVRAVPDVYERCGVVGTRTVSDLFRSGSVSWKTLVGYRLCASKLIRIQPALIS